MDTETPRGRLQLHDNQTVPPPRKLPQLWELTSKKWKQTDPGTED